MLPWPDVLAQSHLWETSHPLSLPLFCSHRKRKRRSEIRGGGADRERHEKGKYRKDKETVECNGQKENMTGVSDSEADCCIHPQSFGQHGRRKKAKELGY